jgi:hypothetical protein
MRDGALQSNMIEGKALMRKVRYEMCVRKTTRSSCGKCGEPCNCGITGRDIGDTKKQVYQTSW